MPVEQAFADDGPDVGGHGLELFDDQCRVVSEEIGFDGQSIAEFLGGPVVIARSGECQEADQGAPEVLGVGVEACLGENAWVIAGREPVESQMDALVPGVVRVEPVGLADALQAGVPGAAECQGRRTRTGSTTRSSTASTTSWTWPRRLCAAHSRITVGPLTRASRSPSAQRLSRSGGPA